MLIFTLNNKQAPINPCTKEEAERLVKNGDAVINRYAPLTIQINETIEDDTIPLKLKIFPGIRTTGISVLEQTTENEYDIIYLLEVRHKKGIADTLIAKRSSLSYEDRIEAVRLTYDSNIKEIMQVISNLKKWLPIGKITMRKWLIEDYTAVLLSNENRDGVLPDNFSVKLSRKDLNALCTHFIEKYPGLFESDIEIFEESYDNTLKKCLRYNLPNFPSFKSLFLGEDKSSRFTPKTDKIKIWVSREKGTDIQRPSLEKLEDIGLFDLVNVHDSRIDISGRCIEIDERSGLITIDIGVKSRKFPIEKATLLQTDDGWEYSTKASFSVFRSFYQ